MHHGADIGITIHFRLDGSFGSYSFVLFSQLRITDLMCSLVVLLKLGLGSHIDAKEKEEKRVEIGLTLTVFRVQRAVEGRSLL